MVSRTPDKSWYGWDEEGGHCEWVGWWANLLGCDQEKMRKSASGLQVSLRKFRSQSQGGWRLAYRHIFAELTRVALSVAAVTVCTDLRVALKARSKGEFIIR